MGSDVVRIHLEFFCAEELSSAAAEVTVNHSVHLSGTGQQLDKGQLAVPGRSFSEQGPGTSA